MFYQGDDTAAFVHSWYASQTMWKASLSPTSFLTLKNLNDDIIPLVTIFIMMNVKVWNKQTNKQTNKTNNSNNNESLNVSKNVHVKGTEKNDWGPKKKHLLQLVV